MKHYKREYEYVFSDEKLIKKKCDLSQVSTYNSRPASIDEYIAQMQATYRDFDKALFSFIVRSGWLYRRFCYRGCHRSKSRSNGVELDRAFGVFLRRYVGIENRMLNSGKGVKMIALYTYLDDLFPNFDETDPFQDDISFPFKNLNTACLILVYKMDERMELLRYADDKGMNYTEFMDYILNYINCFNDDPDHNEFRYVFVFSHNSMPHINKNQIDGKEIKTNHIRTGR